MAEYLFVGFLYLYIYYLEGQHCVFTSTVACHQINAMDTKCSHVNRNDFGCQRESTTTTRPRHRKPYNYKATRISSQFYAQGNWPFTTALHVCTRANGTIMKINSYQSMETAANLIKRTDVVWIGLLYTKHTHSWLWWDGSRLLIRRWDYATLAHKESGTVKRCTVGRRLTKNSLQFSDSSCSAGHANGILCGLS